VEPILHLSIAVRDLDEAVAFYAGALGCEVGRTVADFADVWFFGMQVTLHEAPEQVLSDAQRGARHFGVTLEREELFRAVERARAHGSVVLSELATDYAGTRREQTKVKILDPSGNAIELKTYVDVESALGEAVRRRG
jgi:extradiol dioxygenase family protein